MVRIIAIIFAGLVVGAVMGTVYSYAGISLPTAGIMGRGSDAEPDRIFAASAPVDGGRWWWGSTENLEVVSEEGIRLEQEATRGRFYTPVFELDRLHEIGVGVSIPAQANASLVIMKADSEAFTDVEETRFTLRHNQEGESNVIEPEQFFEPPVSRTQGYYRIRLDLSRPTTGAASPVVRSLVVWGHRTGIVS